MREVKTIQGIKRKHNLFLHTLAVPGLALSSLFPQSGATHPHWGAVGAVQPAAPTEPPQRSQPTVLRDSPAGAGTQLDGAPPSTSAQGRGRQAARGTFSSPHPQGSVPHQRGVWWQETHVGIDWLVPLPPSAPRASQPQQLKCRFGGEECLSEKCLLLLYSLFITYLCPPPQVVIDGKFHFSHYLTKPTLWGVVKAQKPLSLQSTSINLLEALVLFKHVSNVRNAGCERLPFFFLFYFVCFLIWMKPCYTMN